MIGCTSLIRRFVASLKPGQLFTTRDCLGFGKRNSVDQALHKMVNSGWITRLARGVFALSENLRRLVSVEEVAEIKAKAFGKTLLSHGATLAFEMGLTKSNPDSHVFLVTGAGSAFHYGSKRIILKSASPNKARLGESKAGKLLRAVWHAVTRPDSSGVDLSDNTKLVPLFMTLSPLDFREINKFSHCIPAWLKESFEPFIPLLLRR